MRQSNRGGKVHPRWQLRAASSVGSSSSRLMQVCGAHGLLAHCSRCKLVHSQHPLAIPSTGRGSCQGGLGSLGLVLRVEAARTGRQCQYESTVTCTNRNLPITQVAPPGRRTAAGDLMSTAWRGSDTHVRHSPPNNLHRDSPSSTISRSLQQCGPINLHSTQYLPVSQPGQSSHCLAVGVPQQ